MANDFKNLWAAIESAGFAVRRCAVCKVNGAVSAVAESVERSNNQPIMRVWCVNGIISTKIIH